MKYHRVVLVQIAVVIFVLLPTQTFAQFQRGDVELSLSGNLGKAESKSSFSGQSSSSSSSFLLLSISPAYFVVDGLSIEPEVGLLAIEDEKPGQYILGNLSYTHRITESDVAVFGRIGYGISNSLAFPVPGGIPLRMSDKFDIGVFNVGAGVKYVIKNAVALRAELNYRNHTWTREYSYYGFPAQKSENSYSNIGLLVGFSILL